MFHHLIEASKYCLLYTSKACEAIALIILIIKERNILNPRFIKINMIVHFILDMNQELATLNSFLNSINTRPYIDKLKLTSSIKQKPNSMIQALPMTNPIRALCTKNTSDSPNITPH